MPAGPSAQISLNVAAVAAVEEKRTGMRAWEYERWTIRRGRWSEGRDAEEV